MDGRVISSAAPAHPEIDVGKLLAVVVAHHKAGVQFLDDQGGGKRRLISTSEAKRIISQSSL